MFVPRWAALAAAAIAFSAAPLAGAAAKGRIALVIGNSAYSAVSPLLNPANDAELMANTLEDLGFAVTRLIDADQEAMEQAILEYGRALRAGPDASFFYYAGHGVQAHEENYLIPVDAAIRADGELDLEAVSLDSLLRMLESTTSGVNIVVLDACRNNPFAATARSTSRGLAIVDAPSGTYIAFSTAPGSVAEDGSGENSVYTAALATALQMPGLSLEDTFKQARRLVLERTGREQVPWDTSSVTGEFFFTPPATPAAVEVAADVPPAPLDIGRERSARLDQETAFWTSIADSTTSADFEAYLAAFPDGVFAALARNRLAELTAAPAQPEEETPLAALDADGPAGPGGADGSPAAEEQAVAALDPAAAADPVELARALQVELARVGCYRGAIDGIWGGGSRRALREFDRLHPGAAAELLPSPDWIARVKAVTGEVCPVIAAPPPAERRARAETPRRERATPARNASREGRCVRNNVAQQRLNPVPFVIWGTNIPCTP